MQRYRCTVCGHVYDPSVGDDPSDVPPGTEFEELTEDWPCPGCGSASKLDFVPLEEAYPT